VGRGGTDHVGTNYVGKGTPAGQGAKTHPLVTKKELSKQRGEEERCKRQPRKVPYKHSKQMDHWNGGKTFPAGMGEQKKMGVHSVLPIPRLIPQITKEKGN